VTLWREFSVGTAALIIADFHNHHPQVITRASVHRSRIFEKMKVRSAVELSQLPSPLGDKPDS